MPGRFALGLAEQLCRQIKPGELGGDLLAAPAMLLGAREQRRIAREELTTTTASAVAA